MVKIYSPQIEKQKGHKYKYTQRYVDPLRSVPGHIVLRKVAVTLTKKTPQARREARSILLRKINRAVAEQSEGTDITLQELSDKYQRYLKETDRPWNSRTRAAGNLKFINKYFHGAIAKRITTPMINKYLEWCLYERPRKLSNTSTRLRKVYISNVFRYGIDHGFVTHNPAVGVRVKWRDESAKKRERIANKYLTDTEVRAILGYCKYLEHRPDYYYLFKFMYLTGMRINEAAGLKKDDFFQKNGIWYARVNGTEEYHYGALYHREEEGQERHRKSNRTKTKAGMRNVQLDSSAAHIYLTNRDFHTSIDYLFVDHLRSGKMVPWSIFSVERYLKAIGRRLGIPKRITTHFFRHTYISKQAEKRTPLNVIMAQVGQADSKVTKQIYTHVTEKERLDLQESLESMDRDIGI